MNHAQPIGIFDSGYGGLTVMKEILRHLPQYDYIYLGDNARSPYGPRSFERVYRYTAGAVAWLFEQGCPLVIVACNTASAKALRTIQQEYLPRIDSTKRVLGVLRPVTEQAGSFTVTGHIGVLGTRGTVDSESYLIEIQKLFPDITVTQEACPMSVPLVENGEYDGPGADYFIEKHIASLLRRDPEIDALILGCTHYPLLIDKIGRCLPDSVRVISQGVLVAERLVAYLTRHSEIAARCSTSGIRRYFTTDSPEIFNRQAARFMGETVAAEQTALP